MKKETLTTKLFSLSCEDTDGTLSRIIQAFSRPGYLLHTLSQARTDIKNLVLITLEARIPAAKVDLMILRLEKIVGVLEVTASFGAVARHAVYRLSTLDEATCHILQRYQTQVLTRHQGHWLVQQTGHPDAVQKLFNELDGPHLAGFSEQALPLSQPLNWEDLHTMNTSFRTFEHT